MNAPTLSDPSTCRALLIGASSAVGRDLGPRLERQGWQCDYRARRPLPAPNWQAFDLGTDSSQPEHSLLVSLGPLDLFTTWLIRNAPRGTRRIVALSSISARTKQEAALAFERDVAARLQLAERDLQRYCEQKGIHLSIVRLSLVWDGETDQNIAPLLRLAKRYRLLLRPASEGGLRNPIHAVDVARFLATLAIAPEAETLIEIGGPETLSMAEIWRRVARTSGALCLPMPQPLLRLVAALIPGAANKIRGTLARWHCDQLAPGLTDSKARGFLTARGRP
ncbi:hypothetical protein [Ahniella affigens]|uniref:hypothetical protein n=1 Tax=Ahniella affigens TaxID=2021234 RepID=UPI0011B24B2C|nr:hypothetical protein [Ahniella affigens]